MKNKTDQVLSKAIKETSVDGEGKNLCPLPWGSTFVDREIEYLVIYIKKFPTTTHTEKESSD